MAKLTFQGPLNVTEKQVSGIAVRKKDGVIIHLILTQGYSENEEFQLRTHFYKTKADLNKDLLLQTGTNPQNCYLNKYISRKSLITKDHLLLINEMFAAASHIDFSKNECGETIKHFKFNYRHQIIGIGTPNCHHVGDEVFPWQDAGGDFTKLNCQRL